MQNIKIYVSFLLVVVFFSGCKKGNYPGATVSPYIALFDLRDLYKGNDVTLTTENMFGSDKITGIVVSDHSGGNMPAGLVVVQDKRRLSQLRGIAIPIGADAASFKPGDSVSINVVNGILKRVDGILQVTGLPVSAIRKISSGHRIPVNRVPNNAILANPDKFESTLVVIVKAGFNPIAGPTDILAGDKLLNDAFGDMTLHTEPTALFAQAKAAFNANYYGIVFNTSGTDKQLTPHVRLRTGNDVVVLSSAIEVTPVIVSGFMSDVAGGDGNYEYVQLMATKDINFATTSYSVIFTNNANASTPTGYPANGWATGGMRTFKFNLTSGTVAKGSFFYVGGSGRTINGASSTTMSTSKWIRSFNYTTTDGDGFGTRTSGLLANSGNASGIAVFSGTAITVNSRPVDAIFIGTAGSLYTDAPTAMGYRIANTDFYDVRDPITQEDQPFYGSGSNTLSFVYNTADLGYFNMLGGLYDAALGRWMRARNQNNVLLTKTSSIETIEGEGATKLK